MQRVGRKDTAPELTVRRYLHGLGLRYGLHARSLPGKPDIVLPRRGAVVFVNGCFWHGHVCKHGSVQAKTNPEYWAAKVADNRRRDQRQYRELHALGWQVEVIWECQCRNDSTLRKLARRLLAR